MCYPPIYDLNGFWESVTEIMNEYSKYLHPKQFSSSGGDRTLTVLFGDLMKEPKVIFPDFEFICRYISFRISIERLKQRLDNVFLSVIASIPPRYWILKINLENSEFWKPYIWKFKLKIRRKTSQLFDYSNCMKAKYSFSWISSLHDS